MFSSKFYYKCKHAAKCTRKRVDPIVKKKQAMLRFLKKDVADLLAAGHYDNAFRRIDALIVEINHTSCYETIEKCCKYIVKELPIIEKHRECPPEDMEVMGTLVFAAARFSDLPELSDLRRFLMERYGGDMQFPANSEFVTELQNKTFSKEKKLQLMQSIAEEFSVRWDAQMFAHRLSNPPASSSEPTKKVLPSNTDNKPSSTMASHTNDVDPSRDKFELTVARLPRRQQIPREGQVVEMFLTPKNIPLHVPEEKKSKIVSNEPEGGKQHASQRKVPPYADPRSSYNVTHKEDEPKDSIQCSRRPKAQEELDFVDEDKKRLGTASYRGNKPAKSVPPYAKSSGNDNIEGAKGNGVPPYAKAEHAYHVKDVTVNVLENLELGHHEERSQERKSGQPVRNNMRVANMIPPYVKPKAKGVVQEDSSSNAAADDNSKDIEDRDDKLNGYYLDKPKPFSLRRNFRNLPTTESANVPINEKMCRSYAYDGGRRPTNKQNDRDRNNEEDLSRKDSRPPIDVTANVEGNRITMLQTSRVNTKEGNKHLADVHDGKYDETDIKHEKASYHNAGGRRYKVEQNTSPNDEQTSGKICKQPLEEDDKDNAIEYGNLFARTSNERRRHGSRPPVSLYDDEYDEEEMAMDRLLMHYSRKGNERDPVKERKNRDVGSNGFEHPSNGANGFGHPSNGAVPSRSRKPNLPPERAPSPARSVPKQQPDLLAPNCGRVHPKLPDYDNLAARLAALRNL